MKLKLLFISILLFIVFNLIGQTYYVDIINGNDNNNGTSWSNAFKTLEKAIAEVNLNKNYNEIRVSTGVYTAPSGDGFTIPIGVDVFGCFNGSDNYNPFSESPDTINYKTVLKANGGRVLTQKLDFGASQKAVWSGFTITEGNAANVTTKENCGGGAYIQNNMTLRYCNIIGNTASNGGGIYNDGGGVIANCIVQFNTATNGAGIYNHMSRIFNSLIINNESTENGGGIILQGGGITNVTISNNNALNGGGLYNIHTTGAIKNSILYNNNATNNPEIYTSTYDRVYNCIIKGIPDNTGTQNIDINPIFINSSNNNYRLSTCSQAINNGNNAYINDYIAESNFVLDLDGKNRIYNNTVDIGAYEYQEKYNNITRLYVNVEKNSGGDGLSWSSALNSLDDALNISNSSCVNNIINEIYVAKGIYKPSKNISGQSSNRNNAFVITRGVKIYGGFTGNDDNETLNNRDLINNISLLNGKIGNTGSIEDSVYHVMIIANNTIIDSVIIDGIQITGGNANSTNEIVVNNITISQNYGAGIYNAGNGTLTRFSNGKIFNNKAQNGAGVCNALGAYFILDSGSIENNIANINGGGLINLNTSTSFELIGTGEVIRNKAKNGAGVFNSFGAKFSFESGKIEDNIASIAGGGIYSWGPNTILELFGTSKVIGNTSQIGNEIYAGANGKIYISESPTIGIKVQNKGIYLAYGIFVIIPTNIANDAQVIFEAPANAVANRVIINLSLTAREADISKFTYLPTNFILEKVGENIILSKFQASFSNFDNFTFIYDSSSQSVIASISPDSLQNYVLYEYSGVNYGPTSQAPINAGNYQVKAYLNNHILYANIDTIVNLTIEPRPITVSANSINKIYGNTDPHFNYTITSGSLVPGDFIFGRLNRINGEDVGDYLIAQGSLEVGRGMQGNYQLTFISNKLTITTRPISIKANNITIFEGDPEPQLTFSVISGSLTYSDNFTGSLQRTFGVNVGTYDIQQGDLNLSTNYSINFEPGIFTIINSPLSNQTITWDQIIDLTYGDPTFLLNAEASSLLTVSYESSNINIAEILDDKLIVKSAGLVKIKAIQNGNDSFYPAPTIEKTIYIQEMPIVVKADNISKIYGEPDPELTYIITSGSLVSGDVFTGNLKRAHGENVNNYVIGQGSLLLSENYNLSFYIGDFSITKAPIKITAKSGNSIYGDNPIDQGYIVEGLINGDPSNVISGLSNNIIIDSITNFGTYTISVIGTFSSSNYSLTDTNRISGIWNVNAKDISVSSNSGYSTYGDNPQNQGFIAEGLVNNENENVLTGLYNDVIIDSVTSAGKYDINVIGNLVNTNYNILSRNSRTWDVYPKTISVTALGGNSIYGENPSNPGIIATGLVNGETINELTGLYNSFGISSTTFAGSNILTVAGNLSNNNYSLNNSNRIWGVWEIIPKDITVTAKGGISYYGDLPINPGILVNGLVNGETEAVLLDLINNFGIISTTYAGSYTLSVVGDLINGNYNLINRRDSLWVVAPAPATLSWVKNINWIEDTCNVVYNTNPQIINALITPSTDGYIKVSYYNTGSLSELPNEPSNAGIYDIKAELINSTNFNASSISGRLKINKSISTLNWDNSSLIAVYNGTEKAVIATTTTGDNSNITYTYKQNGNSVSPINAGNYDITADLAETTNYFSSSINGTLTIQKASSTLNWDNASLNAVYDGTEKAVIATTTTGNNSSITYTYKQNGNSVSPINAGNYDITADLAETTNYLPITINGTLTIQKAVSTINWDNASLNAVYDGTEKAVIATTTTGNNSSITYTYKQNGNSVSPINAGNYDITADLAETTNYSPISINGTLTIQKAVSTLNWDNASLSAIYDGTEKAVIATTTTGNNSSITYTYKQNGNSVSPINAGNYDITADLAETTNYSPISINGTLTIQKAVSTLNWDNASLSAMYDGTEKAVIATTTTGNNSNITYTYKQNGNSVSPINAGNYDITADLAETTNYLPITINGTLTIQKAVSTLTWDNASLTAVYDGTEKAVIATTTTGNNSNITYTYKQNGNSVSPINAGNYDITADLAETTNYLPISINGTLTIQKAVSTLTWDNASLTAVYDGTEKAVIATTTTGNNSNITYTYKQNGNSVSPINAGNYDITADLAETTNYLPISINGTLTIQKAVSTIEWDNTRLTVVYDGTEKAVIATITTGDNSNITYSYKQNGNTVSPINAGTYDITADLVETTNYISSSINGILTIQKASQVITFPAIDIVSFGSSNFDLIASNSSQLALYYQSSNISVAEVDSNGLVKINGIGETIITVSQPGDNNYFAADSKEQILIVIVQNPIITSIIIGNNEYFSPSPSEKIEYSLDCEANNITIVINADDLLTIEPARSFDINFDKPGLKNIIVTATNSTGNKTDYSISINKAFNFDDIIIQKWDNVLMLDLKKLKDNYEYIFESYKWYLGDELIGTGPYYSAGNKSSDKLSEELSYSVELILSDGSVLKSCSKVISLENPIISIYPNPVTSGNEVKIEASFYNAQLDDASIEVYDEMGRFISSQYISSNIFYVTMPYTPGLYIIHLKGKNGLNEKYNIMVN